MYKSISRVRLLLVFLFLISFTSCNYTNDDSNYWVVAPSTEDSIKAELTLAGYALKDTVDISVGDSISYQIGVSSGKILNQSFKLDTISLIAANGYVHVDTLLAVNKTYPLKFSLWVSPQTGSLADIKGKEGVNFEDSTVLYLRFVDAQ